MLKNYLKFCVLVVAVFLTVVALFLPTSHSKTIITKETVDDKTDVSTVNQEGFHELVAKSYDFRFGKDRPFAPGNATTYNEQFIDPKDFIPSSRCATCHTDVHPQWEESAHANSFVDPFYQKNVIDLQEQKNVAFTRHCESCHNPVALFSGTLTDEPVVSDRSFDRDGVSCIVCHSIDKVDGRGIGGYSMGQPALIAEVSGEKVLRATDDDITNDIDGHKRAMMRPLLKRPEFCAACHKSQVPKELNDYKFQRAFMVGDEYQRSSFSKETPHPAYVREKQTCNTCHMARVETENYDVSVKEETIVSHRFAAANTALPMALGFKKQFEEVVNFLKDDKVAIDIFALHVSDKGGEKKSKMYAPLNTESFKVSAEDIVTADVVITNKDIGHSFPPELRDFYEAFIRFEVKDDSGRVLFKSGYFDKEGDLEKSAHNYKTFLVAENGKLNDLHHIWITKVVAHNNSIQSGRSDVTRYRFKIPNDLTGSLSLKASLDYRRFTKVYSDYVIGKDTKLPFVTMAETKEKIEVGTKKPKGQKNSKEMPDWWRWNNYGIALLDHKQYQPAGRAFQKVIDFKNGYRSRAFVNKAIALMNLGNWKDARKLVSKSLQLRPMDFRTIYQQARIEKNFSRLITAEAKFKAVLKEYPNDRLTLQQLGELSKIKSESVEGEKRKTLLTEAQRYFERILEIDPEDLSATYNLMLISQKLGDRQKARALSRVFQDLKPDTQVAYISREFLEGNPEVNNESTPFHVHRLERFESSREILKYPHIADIDWSKTLTTTADYNAD